MVSRKYGSASTWEKAKDVLEAPGKFDKATGSDLVNDVQDFVKAIPGFFTEVLPKAPGNFVDFANQIKDQTIKNLQAIQNGTYKF
ncbi:hypothetical protein D3C71_1916420 [compost metagenome]